GRSEKSCDSSPQQLPPTVRPRLTTRRPPARREGSCRLRATSPRHSFLILQTCSILPPSLFHHSPIRLDPSDSVAQPPTDPASAHPTATDRGKNPFRSHTAAGRRRRSRRSSASRQSCIPPPLASWPRR